MTTLLDLQAAVIGLLDLATVPAVLQLNSPTRERAFEAYVLALIVEAVRQIGGSGAATIKGIQSGPNPAVVVLRGNVGRLGSKAQDFANVDCQLGQRQFEIHLDVQYTGTSGAIHEIDVSLYDHDMAQRIRGSAQAGNKLPTTSKLIGSVECKFYDQALGTSLGRTFVGLVDDCGTQELKIFATNGNHDGLASYFGLGRRPMPFFELSPTNARAEANFINWIASELRKWARVRS
jgi:hypothetical protein